MQEDRDERGGGNGKEKRGRERERGGNKPGKSPGFLPKPPMACWARWSR